MGEVHGSELAEQWAGACIDPNLGRPPEMICILHMYAKVRT